MKGQIYIRTGQVKALAELNDSETATAIWEALPIEEAANRWGDEIYFSIPLKIDLEGGQELVNAGDLGYWPPGNAFCIFFGPTPISRKGEIRAASPVSIVGKLIDDPKIFKKVKDGESVVIERAES